MFWISDFITFVHISFEQSISRSFHLRAVHLSKDRFSWISRWEYCSLHFWNEHVTDSKILIFWIPEFISFLRKPYYKSLLNSAYLWSRERLAINKKTNISRYQITNLVKIWFLFLVSAKRQNKDKSELVTKFAGIIVKIIFI